MSTKISRRTFLSTLSAGATVAAGTSIIHPFAEVAAFTINQKRLAILGGTPVVKNKVWPTWPYVDENIVAKNKVGTIGDAGCFSFQSSKVICCGEGGAVTYQFLEQGHTSCIT